MKPSVALKNIHGDQVAKLQAKHQQECDLLEDIRWVKQSQSKSDLSQMLGIHFFPTYDFREAVAWNITEKINLIWRDFIVIFSVFRFCLGFGVFFSFLFHFVSFECMIIVMLLSLINMLHCWLNVVSRKRKQWENKKVFVSHNEEARTGHPVWFISKQKKDLKKRW